MKSQKKIKNLLFAGTALVAVGCLPIQSFAAVDIGAPYTITTTAETADGGGGYGVQFTADVVGTVNNAIDIQAPVLTSSVGTGILDFQGNSIVSGSIGTFSALKAITGVATGVGVVTFQEAVNVGTLYLTSGTLGGGDLQKGLTGNVDFNTGNEYIKIGSGYSLTGDVTNSVVGGVLYMDGGTQTVSGDVTNLNSVYLAQAGGDTTLSKTVSSSSIRVYSGTATIVGAATGAVTFLDTGTLNLQGGLTGSANFQGKAGEIVLTSGQKITGTVSTTASGTGTLTLLGAHTMANTIGPGNSLAAINVGASGTTNFNATVAANALNITGTGTVNLTAGLTGALNFGGNNGTVVVTSGQTITGTVSATASSKGTLTLLGAHTMSSTIGVGNSIAVVNAGASGTTNFNSTVIADTLNVTGAGTINLVTGLTGAVQFGGNTGEVVLISGQEISGTVSTTASGTGTLTFLGAHTVSNTIGVGNSIAVVNAGASGTTNFNSTVIADTLNISGTGTVNLTKGLTGDVQFGGNTGEVVLISGQTISGGVNTTIAGTGTFTVLGAATVANVIGATAALKQINAGDTGAAVVFSKTIKAQTLALSGTGTVTLNEGIVGGVDFGANNGTVIVSAGKDITGTVDGSTGVLDILGTTTVGGAIGVTGTLGEVKAGANATIVDFDSDVKATVLTLKGTGRVNLNGDLTGNLDFAGKAADVYLADGKTISGSIDTSIGSVSKLHVLGNSTITSTIGATASLSLINVGATGSVVTFSSATALNVDDINVNLGKGQVYLDAGTTGNVNFSDDGEIILGTTKSIAGTIDGTIADTGIFTLAGDATVNNAVGSVNGLSKVKAGVDSTAVTFNSTVKALTLEISGKGTVSLKEGLVGALDFAGNDGNVVLTSGKTISGAIDTTSDNTGIFTVQGNAAIDNVIGATGALKQIYVGDTGAAVVFSKTIKAQTLALSGTGTVTLNEGIVGGVDFGANNGTVIVSAGKDITGTVDGSTGVLDILGTTTVGGAIGVTGTLGEVKAGANATIVDFDSDVKATVLTLKGTGTVNLNGNLTGKVDFAGNDGTVVLAIGQAISGTIDTTSANTGILTVKGNTTFISAIGSGNSLKQINVGDNGTAVTFFNTVKTQTLDMTGTGTVNLNASLTGNVDFAGNDGEVVLGAGNSISGKIDTTGGANVGTLTIKGSTTFANSVGATGALKAVNAGDDGTTVTFASTFNAQGLTVSGKGTVILNEGSTGSVDFTGNNGTVILKENKTITGNIVTTVANTGTLTIEGSATVANNIGTGFSLLKVQAGDTGKIVTFQTNINAQTLEMSGLGTVKLEQGMTGSIDYGVNDSFVELSDGKTVTGTIDATDTGTLTFLGDATMGGAIGVTGALKTINAGVANKDVTFNANVKAQTLKLSSATGTVNLNANLTGNFDFAGNDGTFVLAENNTVSGTIDTTETNTGNLTIVGNSTVNGAIGTVASLKTVKAGDAGKIVNLNATIRTKALLFSGAGTINLNNNLTGDFDFAGNDGTLVLDEGKTITGAIDTTVLNTGILTVVGAATVPNKIGETFSLKTINAGDAGKVVNFDAAVKAKTLAVAGTGTVNLNDAFTGNVDFTINDGSVVVGTGGSISGVVSSTLINKGTLTFLGSNTMASALGGSGLKVLNVGETGFLNTFQGTVNAQTINVTGGGNVSLEDNTTGDIVFGASASDGTLSIADTKTITGTINSIGGIAGAGIGNVRFLGNAIGTSTIGNTGILKSLTVAGTGTKLRVNGNVAAADTTTLGDNTLEVTGGAFTLGAAQKLSVNLFSETETGKVLSLAGASSTSTGSTVSIVVAPAATYLPLDQKITIIDGLTGGGGISAVSNIITTGSGAPLLYFVQDTTNTDDLVVIAKRRAIKDVTFTKNNEDLATVIESIPLGSAGAAVDAAKTQLNFAESLTEYNERLKALLPPVDSGARMTIMQVGAAVQKTADTRMASWRAGDETGMAAGYYRTSEATAWIQGYGRYSNQKSESLLTGYTSKSAGVVIGTDTTQALSDALVGVTLSYGQTGIRSNDKNTVTDINNFGFNIFSSFNYSSPTFLTTQFGYGYNGVNQERRNSGGPGLLSKSDYGTSQYLAKVTLGRQFLADTGFDWAPAISTSYTYLNTEPYIETGTGANLSVDRAEQSALDVELQMNMGATFRNYNGDSFKPEIHFGYAHEFIGDTLEANARFTGGGGSFATVGPIPSQDRFNLGLGMTFESSANFSVMGKYDYEHKRDYSAHSAIARVVSFF